MGSRSRESERMKEEVKILVVDDEELLRNLLVRLLERETYHVTAAAGGRQALELLQKGDFNILVSDVKMPEMTGLELLKICKEKYPRMAAVLMTAFGDAYTAKDAILQGADEYVIKPFKNADLLAAIERAWWRSLSAPPKPQRKETA
jgi:two-component system response regulator AtoC